MAGHFSLLTTGPFLAVSQRRPQRVGADFSRGPSGVFSQKWCVKDTMLTRTGVVAFFSPSGTREIRVTALFLRTLA